MSVSAASLFGLEVTFPLQSPSKFAVPWALDADGKLVTPDKAASSLGLRCPDPACGSRLVLRAGAVRARHFAHLDAERCSRESAEHWAAKHLLAQVVIASLAEPGARPAIDSPCPTCGKSPRHLPGNVQDARLEMAVDGFVADVLLLDDAQRPICALEVLHTHAVTDEKAEGLSIPWIELAAAEVLANPLRWIPRRAGPRPIPCDHAGTEYLRRMVEAARRWVRLQMEQVISEWMSFPLGSGQYVAVVCGNEKAWRPMDPWHSGSPQEALAVLENVLRADVSRHFRPESTVSVRMRASGGVLVEGEWREGRWVRGPVLRLQAGPVRLGGQPARMAPSRRHRRL